MAITSSKRIVTAVAAVLLSVTALTHAAEPDDKTRSAFDRSIGAIVANDRAAFLTDASDAMRQGITAERLASLSHDLAPHFKAGVTTTYLGDLKQVGLTVRLWKVTFKDGRDDALVRVVMTAADRLDGFFIQ